MANTTNFGWETPDDTDLVKDGAAAMRTLGNAIDASLVDLKGGTTGQVLSKNTNTDMDFVWTTPQTGDITAVTAGSGLSGGGTSGDVTLTNTVATTFDAKGDLVVGTGADTFAKLSVGTNGHTLVADSTTATGLKWAAPVSGSTFVGASVYKTASQSTANATDTVVSFDAESYDTDAFHSNSTNNSRFTIPSGKDGKYLITGHITWNTNATGIRTLTLLKNGADHAYFLATNATNGTSTRLVFNRVVDAVATDYFEITAYQTSTGALDVISGALQTTFQISYLGA